MEPLIVWGLTTAVLAQTFPITDFEAFPAPSWSGRSLLDLPGRL